MLFYHDDADNKLLKGKGVNILVTNNCNWSCGGCHQFCGIITKHQQSKLWNISPQQLDENIEVLIHPKGTRPGKIGIFGGEPTLHPEWGEIVQILGDHPETKFNVWTNGTKPDKLVALPNVRYRMGGEKNLHQATLVAPCDIDKDGDPGHYWQVARKTCRMWLQCKSVIYDNRAYLCEPAAAFDRLQLGKENWHKSKGWELKLGENPFDRTWREIAEQGTHFCYRCGFCLKQKMWQKFSEPYFVSETNVGLIQSETSRPVKIQHIT